MIHPVKARCKTVYVKDAIKTEIATLLFDVLKSSIHWEEGIRSRKGFTRKAKSISMGEFPDIDNIILEIIKKCTSQDYVITNYYLNYYQDGKMYTPNHRHQGTHQLVISLGATRVLELGKKKFPMINGSAILFGGSTHGVPKDPYCKEGRISIATFMIPVEQ